MSEETVKQKETIRKYKIQDCLDNMTKREYDRIIKMIPPLIGKSYNTFNNYKNIRLNDREEIPYRVGIILEYFFDLQPGGLYRYPIKSISYKDQLRKNIQQVSSE